MRTRPRIHGDVKDGFGRVVDVFADNLTARGEGSAAVTLYVSDVPVCGG